ncbi:MAG: hypothetical protein L0G52_03280 [Brachybacterium sp.]|nr:hypothetical protein [Brachybacterium sp.]
MHERRWQAASVGLFWIGFEAFDVRSFGPSVDSAVAGGWGIGADRPAKTLVRLASGFSYDCATGLQDGSGVTCIERAG